MKHYGCHLTNMLAKALSTTNKLITKPSKHHLNEMCNMFWWQKFNPVIHDNFVFSCILQQITERKLTSKVNMQINQTTSWRQAGWKIPPNKHTYMHTQMDRQPKNTMPSAPSTGWADDKKPQSTAQVHTKILKCWTNSSQQKWYHKN